ncbi:MAG: hypothetical protein ACR2NU_13210 [Aeoliella sp.]
MSIKLAILAEQANQTVLEKLDPDRRAAVILALIGLGILGAFLIVATMLAGRWARQGRPYRSPRLGESSSPRATDSIRPAAPPDVNRGDTLIDRPDKDDTMT